VKCDNVFKADVVKENGDGWIFRDDILEKFKTKKGDIHLAATASEQYCL
jgi:hypothetical protein